MGGKESKGSKDELKQTEIEGTEAKPFPDKTQLALQGVKPASIAAVEKVFDEYLYALDDKQKADKALKDYKEKLREVMVDQNVPTYGKKHGNHRWVADTHDKPEITIKMQKQDRN